MSKKPTQSCKGKRNKDAKCTEPIINGHKYCEKHLYFEDYEKDDNYSEIMKNLVKCTYCANMHYKTIAVTCPTCIKKKEKYRNSKEKVVDTRSVCKARSEIKIKDSDVEEISKDHKIYHRGKSEQAYIHDSCRNYASGDSRFCTFHQYLDKYSDDMLKKLKFCSTCHKCFSSETFSTCDVCRTITCPKIRQQHRENKVICKQDDCTFEANESGYCGKHENSAERFKEKVENDGRIVCTNYVRGCRVSLSSDSKYKKCKACREKERIHDNTQRHEIMNKNNLDKINFTCTECHKVFSKDEQIIDSYGNISNKCHKCFKYGQKLEINRIDKHRVRDFSYYIKSAKKRNITWDTLFTRDICEKLFKGKCYYCGMEYIENEYRLGIDRVNNNIGYTITNCVSCCEKCNFMKRAHPEETFLYIVEHILRKYNIVDKCPLHPNVFSGCINDPLYPQYKYSAECRHIPFELTKTEFELIKSNDCYLCGHKSLEGQFNGIDRLDSGGTYNWNNCKACCSTCNYLKNALDLKTFFVHLIKIFDYSINKIINTDSCTENKKDHNITHDRIAHEIFYKLCNVYILCVPYGK